MSSTRSKISPKAFFQSFFFFFCANFLRPWPNSVAGRGFGGAYFADPLGGFAPSSHAKARHMIHRPVHAHPARLVPEPCAAHNSSRWQFCDHGALAPPPHYGFALTAYRETAAAFETLSDPNSPKKGILTKWSHNSRVRSRNPGPSAPRTNARGRSRY